jgi:small subunit ribosomal protein S20
MPGIASRSCIIYKIFIPEDKGYMPNIKSQEKRDRQSIKRTEKNRAVKSRIKTLSKNLKDSVEDKDVQMAQADLKEYIKALDKAEKTKTVHKNFAANKKSKAAKLFNSIQVAK